MLPILPLILAVLVETHVRFISIRHFGTDHPLLESIAVSFGHIGDYGLIFTLITLQCLPLFYVLLFTKKTKSIRLILLAFGLYPIATYVLTVFSQNFAAVNLFSGHLYSLILAFLAISWISEKLFNQITRSTPSILSRIFSLDNVVIFTLLIWTMIISGAFHFHSDPFNNMPINLVIDPVQVITDPLPFLNYWWQFAVMAGLVWGIFYVNKNLLIKEVLGHLGVFHYLVISVIFLMIYTPVAGLAIISLPINPPEFSFLPSETFDVFDGDNYKISCLILFLSTPLILAFERQKDVAKSAKITQQKTQAELKLLQQQINPHFLFNSLNSLYALTLKKSDDAPHLVIHLSDMLRYTVYDGQQSLVSVNKELEYLDNYIKLQKVRLGDRLIIQKQWPLAVDEKIEIAPLMLILILENAFKHGVVSHTKKAFVDVAITVTNDRLVMTCNNSMESSLDSRKGKNTGIGLQNLQRRLELQYPNKYSYTQHIESTESESSVWKTRLEIQLT